MAFEMPIHPGCFWGLRTGLADAKMVFEMPIHRKPGGGSKGKLPMMSDRLIFILSYYKTYPTFDVLASQFDMARSKAHINVHKLSPILYDTLVSLELMPYRRFEAPEDLKSALSGIDQVIIDATERAYRRSEDGEGQKAYYSGKKTAHDQKYHDVES
jgi:hypothetical protein